MLSRPCIKEALVYISLLHARPDQRRSSHYIYFGSGALDYKRIRFYKVLATLGGAHRSNRYLLGQEACHWLAGSDSGCGPPTVVLETVSFPVLLKHGTNNHLVFYIVSAFVVGGPCKNQLFTMFVA